MGSFKGWFCLVSLSFRCSMLLFRSTNSLFQDINHHCLCFLCRIYKKKKNIQATNFRIQISDCEDKLGHFCHSENFICTFIVLAHFCTDKNVCVCVCAHLWDKCCTKKPPNNQRTCFFDYFFFFGSFVIIYSFLFLSFCRSPCRGPAALRTSWSTNPPLLLHQTRSSTWRKMWVVPLKRAHLTQNLKQLEK